MGRLKQSMKAAEIRMELQKILGDSGLSTSRAAALMRTHPNTLRQYLTGLRAPPGLVIAAARWAVFQAGGTVTLSARDSRL
jgi:hypothetical protein